MDMEAPLATIEYSSGSKPHSAFVNTVEALDACLDKLTTESPEATPDMVTVIRRNRDSLTIGLGSPILVDTDGNPLKERCERPLTVLGFCANDGGPPYYVSKGLEPASHNLVFYFGGHWTEFVAQQGIDVTMARQAMREFVTTDGLPSCITWEEV